MRTVRDARETASVIDLPDFEILDWHDLEGTEDVRRELHLFSCSEGKGVALATIPDEDEDECDAGTAEWWARHYTAVFWLEEGETLRTVIESEEVA